jgi:ribosomal protein L34
MNVNLCMTPSSRERGHAMGYRARCKTRNCGRVTV